MQRYEDEHTPDELPMPPPLPTQPSPNVEGDDQLSQLVFMWFSLPTYREEYHFLEEHPELLDPRSEIILTSAQSLREQEQKQDLYDHLSLLRDARARGGSREAIREAYVNVYGGFALDLPSWLELVVHLLFNPARDRQLELTATERRDLLRVTIVHAQHDPDVSLEIMAALQHELGDTLRENRQMSDAQTYEAAIDAYNAALETYTLIRYPCRYAMIQNNRAITYRERIEGERRNNLEQAIASFQAALQVYTRDTFPIEWAMTQHNLSLAYRERIEGWRRTNIEQAIACCQAALQVRTYDAFPAEWAASQTSLGNTYQERIEGERRINLEQAIACYYNALQVHTHETFPIQWATIQNNLGSAYQERIEGERRVNLEQAIICYQAALQIYTRDAFPPDWAMTQNNLGTAYQDRIEGERRVNLEQAIACFQAALQVRTYDTSPIDWAASQSNLGRAYQERIEGQRSANLEQAIACYQEALRVYTRDTFPAERATVQHNLGAAYRERIEGERRANLEQAIAHYQQALRVRTRDAFPFEWASTQHNLGNVYQQRIEGERRINLEQAIVCFQAALQVYTHHSFPVEWATAQHNLGDVYRERIEGERRNNLEQALACYHKALQVRTYGASPVDWAATQHNLGNAYRERIEGERRANLEQAIACFQEALKVRMRDALPVDWAATETGLGIVYYERMEGNRHGNLEQAIACLTAALQIYASEGMTFEWAATQVNLGSAYYERMEGDRRGNLEQAITCFQAALQVYTRESFPTEWATIYHDLGSVYLERMEGDRCSNLEQAIAHYQEALQLRTHNAFPVDWAATQYNLGNAYQTRIEGERRINLEQAIACYQAVLQVYTRDTFPREYHLTQLNRAFAEVERHNWADAHLAYVAAHVAQDLLVRLGAGAVGRDVILKEGLNAATRNGFVLTRLGQLEAATITIERGRVRGLAEILALDAAEPKQIKDAGRRRRYEEARQAFIIAQAVLNDSLSQNLSEEERRRINLEHTEAYHQAMNRFDVVIAEIRAAQDPPDFLNETLDATTILQAAKCGGRGHALVYLAATPWGGIAVAALSANAQPKPSARFALLDLPTLKDSLIGDLLQTELDDQTGQVISGYGYAQEGSGLAWLRQQWPGKTFREAVTALHTACTTGSKTSTLDGAAQHLLDTPALAELVDRPLDQLDISTIARLNNTLNHHFLQMELQRCMEQLAEVAIRPVVVWLLEQGVTSLTLIPCGALAAFPLTAIKLADGRTVGETLPTSIALSARSLLYKEEIDRQRRGVYALGDPRPTHQELPWGEAEAHTLVKLARTLGLPARAKVHEKARRSWLIQGLQIGDVVDASCHGKFDSNDFLQSSLQLAQGKRLTLAEALNRKVDLQGLRLLILSACQTAILDLRGARDEVRSLAAGMIQAGARAVLATLWSVDDKATYLLIVRFAQEWFPRMEQEPPAAALARAQSWLRTVTRRQLQQWQTTKLFLPTVQERRKAGSATPERDPWREEASVLAGEAKLAAVRGRGDRYDLGEAETLIRSSSQGDDLDACPYEDPVYWAGFQIIGW